MTERMVFEIGLWRARCHQCMTTWFALRLTCTLDEELHMVHTWSFKSVARESVVSYCGGGDMYAFEGLAYVKTKSMPA
jgi:formate dehydrogenase maturation protein FdhE